MSEPNTGANNGGVSSKPNFVDHELVKLTFRMFLGGGNGSCRINQKARTRAPLSTILSHPYRIRARVNFGAGGDSGGPLSGNDLNTVNFFVRHHAGVLKCCSLMRYLPHDRF
jgi:hypothetical protein